MERVDHSLTQQIDVDIRLIAWRLSAVSSLAKGVMADEVVCRAVRDPQSLETQFFVPES